jgi:translation initiation factor IF-2
MSDILLNELAKELSKTPETLVKQFADAGITKSTSDKVSLQEKETLTVYLQKQHGGEQKKKMTLQRKTKSTLNVKGQSVNVEVRKKRTYVKRTDTEVEAENEAKAAEEAAIQAKLQAEVDAKKAIAEQLQAEKLAAKKLADEKAKKAAAANKEKHSTVKVEKTAEQIAAEKEAAELLAKADKDALAKAEKEAEEQTILAKKLAEENAERWDKEDA